MVHLKISPASTHAQESTRQPMHKHGLYPVSRSLLHIVMTFLSNQKMYEQDKREFFSKRPKVGEHVKIVGRAKKNAYKNPKRLDSKVSPMTILLPQGLSHSGRERGEETLKRYLKMKGAQNEWGSRIHVADVLMILHLVFISEWMSISDSIGRRLSSFQRSLCT